MKKVLSVIFLFFLIQGVQSQNVWDSIADFGGGQRQRAVSFGLNGKGYVGTGLDTAEVVHNDMWEYNPKNDTWSQISTLPGVGRRNAVSFTIADKAYVGTGVDNVSAPAGTILNDFYEYDPLNNTWVQIQNYPGGAGNGLYFASGFTAGGKGYVCGGKQGPDDYTDDLYEYKPSNGAWAKRESFPGGLRYQMVTFSVDGLAFIGLGADEDIYRKDWWKYNPGSNEWTQMGNFYGNERAAMVSFILNGRGYLSMGTDGGFRDDLWEYNHVNDNWISKENFPGKGRKFASSFTIGDTAYVGIGKANDGSKRSFNRYYPSAPSKIKVLKEIELQVYPNPCAEYFSIQGLNKSIEGYIDLLNIKLQMVQAFNIEKSNRYELRKGLNKGIYFIKIIDTKGNIIKIEKIEIE